MMALGLRASDHHKHQQQGSQEVHKRFLATQPAASQVRPSGDPADKPCIMRSMVPDPLARRARWAPLLSLAVPCFMPQTCPKGAGAG
jgi:hypothetical protein